MIVAGTVMDQLLLDPQNVEMPPSAIEVIRPYVDYLPVLLADDLTKRVTLNTLMSAKLKFLHHILENDYIRKVVEATPEEQLGFFGSEGMISMLQGTMDMVVDMAEGLSTPESVKAILESSGVTEEEVMLGPKLGLNPELVEMYKAGTLTIEDVVWKQPGLIVNNQ